jgi:hypothetical protein
MTLSMRNPHQRALVTLGGLVGFSLLATLVTWGIASAGMAELTLTVIPLIFFSILGLSWIIIWLLGLRLSQQSRAFLESKRPLVHWEYSQVEWQQIKEVIWQEERGDWRIQWGCLTFLLALAGALTGVLIGLEGGLMSMFASGGIGLLLGGMVGSTIGALVAAGNYLGSRQAYLRHEPGQVALGRDEIFVSGDYFKGDGVNKYIQSALLQSGNPILLEIQLVFPPRPRMPRQEQWLIPVPSQWVERVEEILPVLNREPGLTGSLTT